MQEQVILLHGIWMRGITLLPLARRLRAGGYAVQTMDYASVFGGIEPAIASLRERMHASAAERVHVVGHSLGGVVALEATRGARSLPQGHLVCLGPPLRGSAVARAMAAVPGGRWLMGQSAHVLADGIVEWDDARRVGVIAGRLPLGLGIAIGPLRAPHDGTVAVVETQLPGIADHQVVATSHTGMLFSSEVADLTLAFLRHGRFAPAGD